MARGERGAGGVAAGTAGPPSREAWFPAGALIGGVPVEAVARHSRRPGDYLVVLTTEGGGLLVTPDQPIRARRRATAVGGPYGEPEWIAAGRVRLGDWLCRPRGGDAHLWFPVTAVTQDSTPRPLYRYATHDEAVVAYGFLVRTDGASDRSEP